MKTNYSDNESQLDTDVSHREESTDYSMFSNLNLQSQKMKMNNLLSSEDNDSVFSSLSFAKIGHN